jgi:hypothetical protein
VRFKGEFRPQPHPCSIRLCTMPVGTFRSEVRTSPGFFVIDGVCPDRRDTWLIGEPGLWQPLWGQVAAELAAEYAGRVQWYRENPGFPFGPPREARLEPAEFRAGAVREIHVRSLRSRLCRLYATSSAARMCLFGPVRARPHRGAATPMARLAKPHFPPARLSAQRNPCQAPSGCQGRAQRASIAARRSRRRGRQSAIARTSAG